MESLDCHTQRPPQPLVRYLEKLPDVAFNTFSLEEEVPGGLCAFFPSLNLSRMSRTGKFVTEQSKKPTVCLQAHVIFSRFKGHKPNPGTRGSLNVCAINDTRDAPFCS